MKVYIAGRVSQGEGDIAKLANHLESRDHRITLKWWDKKVKKPFLNNIDHSQVLSGEMVNAVKKSDVLILFAEDTILGAATEFGIAIGDDSKKREIIVIHTPETRQSVFYAHPSAIVLQNIDDIKGRPWY